LRHPRTALSAKSRTYGHYLVDSPRPARGRHCQVPHAGSRPGRLSRVTILLGIVGAAVGGWIGTALGFGTVTAFDARSLGIAILGSLVLLVIYRFVRGR